MKNLPSQNCIIMCRLISLVYHYFLLLINFCTYFFKCTNFKKWNNKTYFLLISAFFIIVWFFILSQKSVTRVAVVSSRVMFTFAISSHNYTITICNPEHLEIIYGSYSQKNQLTSWAFATHSLPSLASSKIDICSEFKQACALK